MFLFCTAFAYLRPVKQPIFQQRMNAGRTIAASLFLLFVFSVQGKGQPVPKSFSKQFTITTENDRYMLQGHDRYYTNGLVLQYVALQKPTPKAQKRLDQMEAGQKIYMPFARKIYVPGEIDRPVAGYLYAQFLRTAFPQQNTLWQWGASVGAIGDASLGRLVQNTFHDLINVNSNKWGWVWNYQVKSEVGANLHSLYAKGLRSTTAGFQLVPIVKATLGTLFTNASGGVLLQAGHLRPQNESSFWNAALGSHNTSEKFEWFFYYYPELTLQAYNATVQGGLFRRNKGPITSAVELFVLAHQVGALFSTNRYFLRVSANYQSREAAAQRFGHNYGSLQAGYRIR